MIMIRRLALCAGLAATSFFALAEGNPPATLTISGNHVTAAQFRKGATVVFYSIALVGDGYGSSSRPFSARATDDDKDGTVAIDYPGTMPLRSVWIAADESTGEYAFASPNGFRPRLVSPPALHRHGNAVDQIAWAGHVSYFFYVHPGKGAWTAFCSDGTAEDADGKADFATSVDLAQFLPVVAGNQDKPADLKPGGTLFVVNAYNLRTSILRLDGGILNGAQ